MPGHNPGKGPRCQDGREEAQGQRKGIERGGNETQGCAGQEAGDHREPRGSEEGAGRD